MGKVRNSLAVKSMAREVSGEGQMTWEKSETHKL